MRKGRSFDVVIYGATGFTGSLAAEYMARKGETERWAIAGRNKSKLEALRTRLEKIDARWRGLPIIEASADDPESLHRMAAQTRTVISTVGPYIRYGEPLVAACVEEGTHYCDITGEPEFVDLTMRYHEAAKEKGVKIVSCCGFDSIPHDFGAWLCARELPADAPMTVRGFVRSKGTFSGGTWQSAVQAFANVREHSAKRKQRTRVPASDGRSVKALPMRVYREKELSCWAVPLPTIDPEIVRRSAKTLGEYGPQFSYGHYAQVKKLPMVLAGGVAVGGIAVLAQFEPTLKLLQKVKGSGEGPTEAEREKSWFTATFLGEGGGGKKAQVVVSGGDPGYTETAKMVSECGLALALDELPEHNGVVTPVVGVGQTLVDRLKAAGMGFEVRA